jgi:hypothetical protein
MAIWGDEIRERANREYRARIASVVAAETGKYPIRPRRPRPVVIPPGEPQPKRGVYELEFAPQGRRAFHLVASNGDVAYVDMPAHWVNRDFVKNLWRRLDREDPPRPQLTVIHPDA